MKTPEWYAEDLRRHEAEKKRTSIGMMKDLKRMDEKDKELNKKSEEKRKRILAHVAQRKADQAAELLKNAKPVEVAKPKSLKRKKQLEEMESLHKEVKQTKIPNLSSLKRKHQLVEMEMLKKEIEHSKIPDIKLNDEGIEGMISKLDELTKSKVLRKQVKDLLEEFEKDMKTNIKGILFKIDILINKLY